MTKCQKLQSLPQLQPNVEYSNLHDNYNNNNNKDVDGDFQNFSKRDFRNVSTIFLDFFIISRTFSAGTFPAKKTFLTRARLSSRWCHWARQVVERKGLALGHQFVLLLVGGFTWVTSSSLTATANKIHSVFTFYTVTIYIPFVDICKNLDQWIHDKVGINSDLDLH